MEANTNPTSPLRQIQHKIINMASGGSTSWAPGSAPKSGASSHASHPPANERRTIDPPFELSSNGPSAGSLKDGIYKATLIELREFADTEDEDEENEENEESRGDKEAGGGPQEEPPRLPKASPSSSVSKPTTIVKPLPPKTPPKSKRVKCFNLQLALSRRPRKIEQLFRDEHFLRYHFFDKLSPLDRCSAAQVCRQWRQILYSNRDYWRGIVCVIDFGRLRRERLAECIVSTLRSVQQRQQMDEEEVWRIQELCYKYARGGEYAVGLSHSKSASIPSQISSSLSSVSIGSLLSPVCESSRMDSIRERLYTALDERCFDEVRLSGATDEDLEELVCKTRPGQLSGCKRATRLARLSNCPLTDRGLELFVASFTQLEELELTGCNELSNQLRLRPLNKLRRLIITDCINMADGLAQSIAEIFHQLEELVIQAYHLTDAFLDCISINCDTTRLRRLELPNCKEISNGSVQTISKHFTRLETLSLSGSSRITDDGLEFLAEHAKQLRALDLGWCAKITDVTLECIACDLGANLEELILDRNVHISDLGLGYLATMSRLSLLYIRWCPRITDLGLESVLGIRSLRALSLAGLSQLTSRSLLCLVDAPRLEELELTNCDAATDDLMQFLRSRMPQCHMIF